MLKTLIKKILNLFQLELKFKKEIKFPPELSVEEIDAIRDIKKNNLTMGSIEKLIDTALACKYILNKNIDGDFVECGVWRGGHSILAKKILELNNSNKKVWMFDTFSGMTEPTEVDKKFSSKDKAIKKYTETLNNDFSRWCYSSIEEVKDNCKKASLNLTGINFIKGDILDKLENTKLPNKISFLRLDTDWYESTKKELEYLYPLLVKHGVITIDDYGSWEGSKKAVDEYFLKNNIHLFLQAVTHSQRTAIKV